MRLRLFGACLNKRFVSWRNRKHGVRFGKILECGLKFTTPHTKPHTLFPIGQLLFSMIETLDHTNSRCLSEPEIYGDLVYKFKKNLGRNDFLDQFWKIMILYKRIGYNRDIMRHTACLVVNPIKVNNFACLFNCTPAGRASDLMIAPA